MEEYTQITLDQWMQWKEDIRRKLEETADNFVYIGYRLKQIRDSGMFGGAADVFEFAQQEYGLGKSTVSRFIAINEKYSEGGNSLELREEFRNFSYSKLSEMLTLPDKEIELINERTTIRAIRELKKFDAEDPGKEPGEEEAAERTWTPLEKCVIDFFKDKRDVLEKVMGLLEQEEPDYKQAEELMNPSGQAFHKKGLVFLFLYEWKDGVKYKLMTSPDPVEMGWRDFLNTVYGIYSGCTPGQVAEEFYGLPEKTAKDQENQELKPVATSQQEEEKPVEKEPEKEAEKAPEEVQQEAAGERQEDTEEPDQEERDPEGEAEEDFQEEDQESPETVDNADEMKEEPEVKPAGKNFREEIERIREAIAGKVRTIQTDISFAENDISKWIKIKMGIAGATGLVQDMIKYIRMENEETEGQQED